MEQKSCALGCLSQPFTQWSPPLSFPVQEAARRIARVSAEAKLPVTEKDYVNVCSATWEDKGTSACGLHSPPPPPPLPPASTTTAELFNASDGRGLRLEPRRAFC